VYAENAGAFAAVLDRIIPGVLWTVLGGYGLLVALVLTCKGFRSPTGTILSVIVTLLLSVFFVHSVWQSDFCAAAHPLFIMPLAFCQQFILVWLCLLPVLLGVPMAQCYAYQTAQAARRRMVWFMVIPSLLVWWGVVGGHLVWGNRLPTLLHALTDPNPIVRAKAVQTLARSSDPRAVAPQLTATVHVAPLLTAAAYESNETVRRYAQQTLIHLGVPAIAPLSALVPDGNPTFRSLISDILGHIGGPQVVEPLIIAGGLRERSKNSDNLSLAQFVIAKLVSIGTPAVAPLITVLEDPNNTFANRARAAWALVQIGDARAILPLIAILTAPDHDLSKAVEGPLSSMGAPTLDPLSVWLNEENESARAAACRVFRHIGQDPAVKQHIARLKDQDSSGGVDRCLRRHASTCYAIAPGIAVRDGCERGRER
jgi:HEAT repeat protein